MLESLDLDSSYDEAARCNRCGFCQAACPTYQATGVETNVARGRNAIARALIEGGVEDDPTIEQPLAECLLCGACTGACFPGVRTHDLVVRARARYKELHGQGRLEHYALHDLLPDPERIARLARLASMGKRSGLSGVVQVFRRLGTFGKHVADAEDFVERVPGRFLRELLRGQDLRPAKRAMRVGYFIGCGINFALPEAGLATIRVLRALGCEPVVLDHVCCGLPAYAYGDIPAAQTLARLNVEAFRLLDVDAIVTDCSSCASFIKDYATLLPGSDEAQRMSARTRDLTEWVAQLDRPVEGQEIAQKVTYHRPCHQVRHQQLVDEPVRMIESAPGVTYVPLDEADWCCGGAGSYNVMHRELSLRVLDRKMGHVASTGADVLTSCCPSCLLQLSYGVRRHNLPVEVRHISEILCERLGADSTLGMASGL